MSDKPTPSRETFRRLAAERPEELLDWIDGGTLEAHHLTFAAEIAGGIVGHDERVSSALEALLLQHDSAVVREGATYGLINRLATLEAERDRLREENERYRKALEFYAEREHYDFDGGINVNICHEPDVHTEDTCECDSWELDCGDRARAALRTPHGEE